MTELKELQVLLCALESDLQAQLQGDEEPDSSCARDPQVMIEVKILIDRIRPLMWIYLHRQRLGSSRSVLDTGEDKTPTYIEQVMEAAGIMAGNTQTRKKPGCHQDVG